MDTSQNNTFKTTDFNVQVTNVGSQRVCFEWQGVLRSPNESQQAPVELTDFLQSKTRKGDHYIENIEFHFEEVHEIRSNLTQYLIYMLREMLLKHKSITLFHSSRISQRKNFELIKKTMEALKQKGTFNGKDSIIEFKQVEHRQAAN